MDFKHLDKSQFQKSAVIYWFAVLFALFQLAGHSVQALPLKTFPNHPQFSFDPGDDGPEAPKCSEIRERMDALKKIIDESQYSLITFMQQGAEVIEGWHADLRPLEGKQASLPAGLFAPLEEGANSILELTDIAYDNADYVSRNFEQLMEALDHCIPQQGE